MAALAALYPAKLQKVAAFDRFGHYRLETGEQLLVWTPIYPAGPLPLIIYLHGASSRGDDISQIFEKGPGCPPALLRAGDIAPRAVVVAPLLAAKREWCKTSREAATTLKLIDAYFAEEARGCVEINQCDGCTRQFFTKSFLGDDAADLARSSGKEPASPRHRAGVASMAWRTTRRERTVKF